MRDISVCRKCGGYNLKVVDSRPTPDGGKRRSRKCMDCGEISHSIELDRDDYDFMVNRIKRFKGAIADVLRAIKDE